LLKARQHWHHESPQLFLLVGDEKFQVGFDNGMDPKGIARRSNRWLELLRGLRVRNTPAYSPESNGMAEAFVKTFKRDCARERYWSTECRLEGLSRGTSSPRRSMRPS
jgi:hypothetical protein